MTPSTSTLSAPPARETPGAGFPPRVPASGANKPRAAWSRLDLDRLQALWDQGWRADAALAYKLKRSQDSIRRGRAMLGLQFDPKDFQARAKAKSDAAKSGWPRPCADARREGHAKLTAWFRANPEAPNSGKPAVFLRAPSWDVTRSVAGATLAW